MHTTRDIKKFSDTQDQQHRLVPFFVLFKEKQKNETTSFYFSHTWKQLVLHIKCIIVSKI